MLGDTIGEGTGRVTSRRVLPNPQEHVKELIAGPAVFICDESVAVCVDIMIGAEHSKVRETELLPVGARGSLCGQCADAVEDALAEGNPIEE